MLKDTTKIRIFSLGLLCFQGFGLRIFEGVMNGAIVLWTLVLLILNWKNVKSMPINKWIVFACLCLFYLLFNWIKGTQPALFVLVAWVSSFIVLSSYWNGKNSFVQDLSKLCRFCMYYSLLHIPIMILFNWAIIKTNLGMEPKTFLYLFWFNGEEGFMGLNRIQGFCWEPSCWNLLLNLNLVFTLYFKKPLKELLLSIFAIVSIMATTGLVVMAAVFVTYYILFTDKKRLFRNAIILGLFALLVAPFINQELQAKLSTGSGNARVGDFAIASAVILNHPFLGADLDNISNNPLAIKARNQVWDSNGDYKGYMEQGMVNSFASLVVEWGVPLFLLLIILIFKSPLFKDTRLKIIFMVALLGVLMGTPISRTGFFYLFVFSSIVCHNYIYTKKIYEKNNINCNSNIQC